MTTVTTFDDVADLLDYPMVVVTTAAGGVTAGCLVGFSTQISIDPARYLVGLSEKNHTYRVAQHADRLVVHLLDHDAEELARLFGAETDDDVDKFGRCSWQPDPHGCPVLDDAAAWFGGAVVERLAAGDHTAFVIDVDAAEVRRRPRRLLSFADVRDLDPGHQP